MGNPLPLTAAHSNRPRWARRVAVVATALVTLPALPSLAAAAPVAEAAPPAVPAVAATPTVSLMAAQGIAPVGTTVTARARVAPAVSGATGFVEVWHGGDFVRVQQGVTNSLGGFTLPLSYGAGTPGTYTFRLGATVNGTTGRTPSFTVTRTPSLALLSAKNQLTVGFTGTARGGLNPAQTGRTGFAEVWYGTRWARISSAVTNSAGVFTVPLSYGVNSAGTHTFRLGATTGTGNVYSRQFAVTRRTESPTPAPVSGGWPNAANTGVPTGTVLTPYTGPTTITADNTVIDAKTVNGTLRIMANNVRITRSVINGGVSVRYATDGSFSISDSEVRIQNYLGTGLDRHNFTANRVEVTGGRRSIYCETNCTIENSWVHGQAFDPDGQAHMSGIRMSQNTTIRHNTITCEGRRTPPESGCSAGLTGYGDTAPVRNNLIENNLFIGGTSTMCAYGGSSASKPYASQAGNIRFINNVFRRGPSGHCGNLGTIASFDSSAPGNVWTNNLFDDGTPVRP